MEKIVIIINGRGGVGKDTLCDLAAKYLQFYSFQKGKTVSLSYGRKKVIEEILSISYNQSQCFTDKICCLKKYLIG